MVIVLVTVFVLGGLTIDTLKALSLQTNVDIEPYLKRVIKKINFYFLLIDYFI